MRRIAFVGPSIPPNAAQALAPEVTLLPPARAGDVYRAVGHGEARVIGLVDGVFGSVGSVWHKEILFAISRGCQVFGGASMGALRAAECRSFGIRGVGTVYAAYADGELEDDDEVAVSHLDAAFGYECLTVPMVTVRAALSAAVSVGLLPERDHERALKAAKNVFYADRTWDVLGREWGALDQDWGPDVTLFAQQPQHDVKAVDAAAVLRAVQSTRPEDGPRQADWQMEPTVFWRRLVQETDFPSVAPWFEDDGAQVSLARRIDVVRGALLDPGHAQLGTRARLFAHLVYQVCEALGIAPSAREVQERSERIRRVLGLGDARTTRQWLLASKLTVAEWQRAIRFQLMAERLGEEYAAELRHQVPMLVAASGGWAQVEHLAEPMQLGVEGESPSVVLTALATRPDMPSAATLEDLAARLGFTSLTEFLSTTGVDPGDTQAATDVVERRAPQ